MKKISTLSQLFFVVALFSAALPCQANQQENRFLFIVDTAAAMRGYSNAVVQGVAELLDSDMRGELRKGDTIGLWTYNEKLSTEFPMQVWSKENKSAIAADMAVFLQAQRYQRQAHLERVMPTLNQVVKNSERLTVIIVFDGAGSIQGTPFDRDINSLQKKYAHELRSAHVPFVTVLAVRDGAVFDYTINYPGLVAIPHTANPEVPPETNAPVAAISIPVTNAPVKPRPMGSIIMSSKTNVAVHAAAPPPENPAPPVAAVPVPVPAPPVVKTPAPVSQPVIAATVPPPTAAVTPANQPVIVTSAPPPRGVAPPQIQPAPPPVVARQNPEPAIETPAPQAPPASVTANNQPQPPALPVARTAPVASIPPSGNGQLPLFVMAFSLLTIAVVLVVFLIRRSRGAPQPSLISQSIDRPR